MNSKQETFLINWVYYPPIGHAVEGLRRAIYARVNNPGVKIAVLLSAGTTFELGRCVPQIDDIYTVDVSQFNEQDADAALGYIPRDWDYFFTEPCHDNPTGSEALDQCQMALHDHVRARIVNDRWGMPGFPEGGMKNDAISI